MNIQKADFRRAESEALNLLDKFDISKPPINPIELARNLKIHVRFTNFGDYQNILAFFDYKTNTIYVNEEDHPNRQTFSIAHELGHYLLHTDYLKSSKYQAIARTDSRENDNVFEKEANAFAANLLVPKKLLLKYSNHFDTEDLSRIFLVSKDVIDNRINFIKKFLRNEF